MADYDIILYLAGGATAKTTLDVATDDEALRELKRELDKQECVLKDRKERLALVIKEPKANVIGYSVDRVET